MGLLLSVIFFVISLLSLKINHGKITHTFVFSMLWAVIMLLESAHFFGLYESKMRTYSVIAIGVLSFAIGSLTFRRVVFRSYSLKDRNTYFINTKWLFFFLAFTVLLLLYPAILNLMNLHSGATNLIEIRASFSNIYSNTALSLLYNYIALPFSVGCLPIVAVMSFSNYRKRTRTIMMLMVLIVIVERILIDAGRGILLYFFVMFFFAYKLQLSSDMTERKKKSVRRTLFFVLILVVAVYLMISIRRGGASFSALKQIYIYLCGCVPFLDASLEDVSQHQYLYSAGGLHGLYQFVFTMLENLRLLDYPEFMQQADLLYNNTLQQRMIGSSLYFNAYATAFYSVYSDGGCLAVFIEMFLYGALSRSAYNKMRIEPNNSRIKAIYIFLLYGITFSFIRYQFALSRNIIAFVFIIFIIRNRVNPDEDITSQHSIS